MTTQEPTAEKETSGVGGMTYNHPAYGSIRANRVQGSRKTLYASDFNHNHYVVIEIGGSQINRGLNHDRHFDREPIVRVAMSEAQWAAFVSSMGHMSVPCTIERKGFEGVPQLPPPIARTEQFSGEMSRKLDKVVARLKAAAANAKTKTHRHEIEMAMQELTANVDFIAGSFDEHMEGTVEKAKAEIHGFINNTIQRAGLEVLQGAAPFALETQSAPALEDHSQ